MLSRVTAEFETPELAEYAMKRIRENVDYVYSAKMIYNRFAERAERLGRSSAFTIIPTYYNTHTNFLTSVMESPASKDIIPEPARNRKATTCIICGSAAVDNVIAFLNAMGGMNIKFDQ